MKNKYIIVLSTLMMLGGISCWGAEDNATQAFKNLIFEAASGSKKAERALIELLETGNVDVNYRFQPSGDTALIWAAFVPHERLVRILLNAKNINVNAENNYGETALSNARSKGYDDIERELVARGAL